MDSDFDLDSDGEKRALLEAARVNFAGFYRSSTVEDASLMDALVFAHVALKVGMSATRDGLHERMRDALERTCDKTEVVFTDLRERVRACPTFVALRGTERHQIERLIFDIRPLA